MKHSERHIAWLANYLEPFNRGNHRGSETNILWAEISGGHRKGTQNSSDSHNTIPCPEPMWRVVTSSQKREGWWNLCRPIPDIKSVPSCGRNNSQWCLKAQEILSDLGRVTKAHFSLAVPLCPSHSRMMRLSLCGVWWQDFPAGLCPLWWGPFVLRIKWLSLFKLAGQGALVFIWPLVRLSQSQGTLILSSSLGVRYGLPAFSVNWGRWWRPFWKHLPMGLNNAGFLWPLLSFKLVPASLPSSAVWFLTHSPASFQKAACF